VVWDKPGTQSKLKNSGIKIVMARDRQRWPRISGVSRGQSKSTIKDVAFIEGQWCVFFRGMKKVEKTI